MNQTELYHYVIGVLERMGLPYFVTGSVATSALGEPRMTNDLDIVVDLPETRVDEFCGHFPDTDFYLSVDAVRWSLAHRSQFNIVHPASGLKIDVMTPPDDEFARSRFARALRMQAAQGLQAWFSSPEDIILKKMDYYREGGSEKHLRDIAGVIKVQGEKLDQQYIQDWAARLGLSEIWEMIQRRLAPPRS